MKFIVLGKKHLIALGLVLLVGVFVLLAAAQGMSQSAAAGGRSVSRTVSSMPSSSQMGIQNPVSLAATPQPGINASNPS
ncbi:hypothetical protein [Solibaculum mannosilyticum]|uniref:Uncharacterized protein n=1 Tax=Solibaculum mannosilyticum TaxID=2780922 RepID=A0A7I8CZV8_9FIRM|nr:hypothetical protein [Solibaculum mannosilyticum]BCI60050.1 hypothetical protein C12CBH8_06890 [Solibaculum mannosilyticum]